MDLDLDEQFNLGHLLFHERVCRMCGERKNLMEDFYRIRKNKASISSSYSYECKECTIQRIKATRSKKRKNILDKWEYPDW